MADRVVLLIDDAPAMIDERIDAAIPRVEQALSEFDTEPFRRQVDEMVATHLAVTMDAVTRERLAAEATIANERTIVLAQAERLIAEVMDDSFERVQKQIDANLARLVPLGIAVMVGPFVLGLLACRLLRRRPAS
jgi:AcrR family transcriptional regulator